MTGPTPELADIFRQHAAAYRQTHALPLYQHRLMQAIVNCRTAALGGAVEWCDHCQNTRIVYRSCRDRHCPKCQGLARERWIRQRLAELLPVEYFHLVFTVPEHARAHFPAANLYPKPSMQRPATSFPFAAVVATAKKNPIKNQHWAAL